MSHVLFSDRIRNYIASQGISGAELGRRLGVSGQWITRLLDNEEPSKTIAILFERLEREVAQDSFLTACRTILDSDDEGLVAAFALHIHSVLANVDPKESERLKAVRDQYLEGRKARRAARSGEEEQGHPIPPLEQARPARKTVTRAKNAPRSKHRSRDAG